MCSFDRNSRRKLLTIPKILVIFNVRLNKNEYISTNNFIWLFSEKQYKNNIYHHWDMFIDRKIQHRIVFIKLIY